MADAILSVVAERLVSFIGDKIWEEVNLVRGFDDKVDYLSRELKKIRRLLNDAEKNGLDGAKSLSDWKSTSDWLTDLEDASYELDDVLDEWYTALDKFQMQQPNATAHHVPDPKSNYKVVCNYTSFLSCTCVSKHAVRRDTAKKLEKVKQKIDSILAEKDRYGLVTTVAPDSSTNGWRGQTTSNVEVEKIYGRDLERDDLVMRVISPQTNHLQILSVVGVGGLGKTTLTQLVYNDTRVTKCFELRIWICVSDPFDEVRIAQAIIKSVTKISPDSNELEYLVQSLKDCVSGKKFLLVMDDVWNESLSSKWEQLMISLKNGSMGSKVLVTTRNERVAKVMGSLEDGIHRLGVLSDDNCWLLLQCIALSGREGKRFESIGKNIANKCEGLPLAAKVLGSLLRFKTRLEEWENVLNCDIWKLEEAQVELFPHLLLSYNELSPTLKRCFSYCAVFPKDTRINVEELIGHWMAVGYLGSGGNGTDMELKGREYYDNLAMRCMFQDFEKNEYETCKMHDIVHDFAELLRKKGDSEVGIKNTSSCKDCSPLLVSHAKQYRSIYFGNMEHRWPRCSCLANLRVARSIGDIGVQRIIIPHGIERFIHLRWLDLSYTDLAATKDMETICRIYNLQTLLLKGCNLKDIPSEMGNLIHLRHLNLEGNGSLKELPESICDLQELQRLNIKDCKGICRLPQGFHRLVDLKHLHNDGCGSLVFPQGVAQLSGLRTLTEFRAGSGKSKLRWLKNLNSLSGSLELNVHLSGSENIVDDAREGELKKKECIKVLEITFDHRSLQVKECEYWESVLNALEPHPELQELRIFLYKGSKLPRWMVSPLNQLKYISLRVFDELSSLPPLGRLPCLEDIMIEWFEKMEVVGPEFLGTTTQGSNSNSTIAFPKLKSLTFWGCDKWREWEDISEAISVMPCLTELNIRSCKNLRVLPHRLLGSSLEKLTITYSTQLEILYGDRQGSAWKSISEFCPRLRLSFI